MNRNRGISKGIVAIGVFCIILIVAGAIYYFVYMPTIPVKPEEVELTGTVTTTGTGTTPEKITFMSMSDGKTYVAACEGGGNPATYCISLPNEDSYKVTITWKAFGLVTGGDADAGTLNLDETEETIVRNWAG